MSAKNTKIMNMIKIKKGCIENAPDQYSVDTIVNAANPTLMGSDSNVDGAIHRKVGEIMGKEDFLKKEIKKQIDGDENGEEGKIRCRRGSVVITQGFGLCDKIIHTVGPETDKYMDKPKVCSSSRMETLESCYRNIIKTALKDGNIKKIAVPVISSGHYGLEFETAFRTALATVYNTLLDEWQTDKEFFEWKSLSEIIFLIPETQEQDFSLAEKIFEEYRKDFEKGMRVVSRDSVKSQKEFLKEIKLYDEQRGYFSIAKGFRFILVLIRLYLFPLSYLLKDRIGGMNWIYRRRFSESFAIIKMIIPVVTYIIIRIFSLQNCCVGITCAIMLYNLAGTATYLLSLIVLADIQRPSANIIRSMILLCVNYLEICLDLSLVYYLTYAPGIGFWEMLNFAMLSNIVNVTEQAWNNYMLLYLNEIMKFFFLTLTFGYLANHLRPRKFLADKGAPCDSAEF